MPSAAAVIGAGVNGRAVARTFLARGHETVLWDVDAERARAAADELGAGVAASREEALAPTSSRPSRRVTSSSSPPARSGPAST